MAADEGSTDSQVFADAATQAWSGEAAEVAEVAEGLVAARVGRYALVRKVGVGGMGEVYAAYDEELDRRVALKLLRGPKREDLLERARVVREAQALARLSDPHVVQVYEVGVHDRQVFVAMEFVEGPTLRQWIRAEPRGVAAVLHMYAQAGHGLQAAHAAGLVHRDFKPDNVLVGRDDRVRVVDFGLARAGEDADAPAVLDLEGHAGVDMASPLTLTGALIGTPAYMSPEQWRCEPIDARSDQFSFCAALWEALYGHRPFKGPSLAQLAMHVMNGTREAVDNSIEVPPRIQAALIRGLMPNRMDRWPDMAALLRQIDLDPARDPSLAARSRRRFMIGFVGLGAVSLVWADRTFGAGPRPEEGAAAYAAVLLVITLSGVALVRRTLLRNAFHRGMLLYLVLVVGQLCVQRVVSMVAGYAMADIFVLDALGMCLVSAAAGMFVARWAWSVAALMFAAALVAAGRPELAASIVPGAFGLAGLVFVVGWSRSASGRR